MLPPLSAVGAIVAILTDSNGASLTGGAVGGGQTPTYCTYTVCRDGQNILTHPDFSLCAGVSVLFSFVVLGFVAHLDDALSQIFVGPGTMRRCEEDIETCFKAEKGMVKIHWLWNRAIAILLATLGTVSVLQAEQLMRSPFVRELRANFFLYPFDRADEVQTRGSGSAEACNQLYQSLVMVALFGAWLLALLSKMKSFLVGPQLHYYSPHCLAVPPDFWTTRPTICSRSWCTNALRFAFRAFIGYALTFGSILATWLVFAVWIGGKLTLSDRAPNHF